MSAHGNGVIDNGMRRPSTGRKHSSRQHTTQQQPGQHLGLWMPDEARQVERHGADQVTDFGYNLSVIHGSGLPDYMMRPPPRGPDILTNSENMGIDNFFNDFEGDRIQNPAAYFPPDVNNAHPFLVPEYHYSETYAGQVPDMDSSNTHMHTSQWADDAHMQWPNMLPINGSQPPSQGMLPFAGPAYLEQLQNAAGQAGGHRPVLTPDWQQARLPPQSHPPSIQGRDPLVQFGTDSGFTRTGFNAPAGLSDHHEQMEWNFNSGPNTEPNTQPNTQPSSPTLSKKRKLDDVQTANQNGYHMPLQNSYMNHPPHSRQSSTHQIKYEADPTSSHSASRKQSFADDGASDDAAAESDDDPSANPTRTASPSAPWPSNRPRPAKAAKITPAHKTPRKRQKSSTSASTPKIPKPKAPPKERPTSTRVPLTSEQKKANHTNSEQKRRDAQARLYAKVYDLVPETSKSGKISTMKKLELVVEKVEWVKGTVADLRKRLNIREGGSVAAVMKMEGLGLGNGVVGGPGMLQENAVNGAGEGSEYPDLDGAVLGAIIGSTT